jgi:ribose 5-phosphate isomerase A
VVIADASKRVETLGAFPLPVEVNLFGIGATTRAVEAAVASAGCTGEIVRRLDKSGQPILTDGGHALLDLRLGRIPDPEALSARLWAVPGVVEHGLFLGIADAAILAAAEGDQAVVSVLGRL